MIRVSGDEYNKHINVMNESSKAKAAVVHLRESQ